MTETRASELILQNLTAIYGYAFSRLYDKNKVEDLASEIICEILSSVKNLKDDTAFWGFAWKIAENTFRKFIRREELTKQYERSDSVIGIYENSVENEYIEREEDHRQVYLLRRELSLLSKAHRVVCIAYYIENKSCSQIAKEQNISVEMVKYYLFKSRKILKEGVNMTRKLGEKSYNPGVFRIDFWGDRNQYGNLFKRKLPGSIILTAYPMPMSAEEISIELGVSMPYLEEEIEILEAAGVLTKVGNKYQTNLVIITDHYEREVEKATSAIYSESADSVFETAKSLLAQIRELDFHGNDYEDNRLMFALLNIAMVNAYIMARGTSPLGSPNKLALGGTGWIFGYDNDYANCHFCGVTMQTWNQERNAWFSAVNYRVISECQNYDHFGFAEKVEDMCDAVLGCEANKENEFLPGLIRDRFIFCQDNILTANFPVFQSDVYARLCEILSPITEMVSACMISVSDQAQRILEEHVPPTVRAQCGDIAKIHHRLDVAAFMMEDLITKGKLVIPTEKTPLCVWGVRA